MYLDTVIKQQLSSLVYVKNLCETRIQQLRDGIEDADVHLPGVSGPLFTTNG